MNGAQTGGDAAKTAGGSLQEALRPRKRVHMGHHRPVALNMFPAMALFTCVLVSLLKDYSTDPVQIQPSPDTQLPRSDTKLPPQKAVQIAISTRAILVDNAKVAEVTDGQVKVIYKQDANPASMVITPLLEVLQKKADQEKMIARYNTQRQELQFKGMVTIIADKRIPFRLLTEVLYTAGQAEYGQYKFAVIKTEGSS